MNQSVDEFYDYTTSGLDGFLSRSIDNLDQVNLDAAGPASTQSRFDFSQVSGVMGNRFRTTDADQQGELNGEIILRGKFIVGNITLDGEEGSIDMVNSDQRVFLSFRTFDDGDDGFIIVKRGYSVSDVLG